LVPSLLSRDIKDYNQRSLEEPKSTDLWHWIYFEFIYQL
jgi:hypothetical protein